MIEVNAGGREDVTNFLSPKPPVSDKALID